MRRSALSTRLCRSKIPHNRLIWLSRPITSAAGQTHLNLFDKNTKFCVAGKAGKLLENRNIFSGKLREFLF
jgi:hypothetical protein